MLTKQTFPVIGIHCASCKVLLEKMVGKVAGVSSVNVNFATEKMTVEYDDAKASIADLKAAVNKAGSYKLIAGEEGDMVLADPATAAAQASHVPAHSTGGGHHDHAALKRAEYLALVAKVKWLGLAVSPFVILMIWMLLAGLNLVTPLHMLIPELQIRLGDAEIKLQLLFLLQFMLATPTLFIGGSDIFASAWAAAKARAANMDTLIAIGTFTAWLFSSLVTFFPGLFAGAGQSDVFFEAAVFIIFFIMLGRLLEARAKGQANDAIQKLLQLQAKEATVIRDGGEVRVPIAEVAHGDIIVVKPGEKVPVDGEIVQGS
ncbi:heavy metal translocating P-type ATPase, partial [Candidatus Dojkabacteria bacterium]|nr:heavy metal translocating P-type ATPase [Candidatus Dojkabacteria bacterium]